jgi:hypothetical protein
MQNTTALSWVLESATLWLNMERVDQAQRVILWLILVFVAAFLRLAPIAASLPYIDYVDEGYALHQS